MEALSGTMYDASARECLSNTMADIFISYAKADRPLALKLAAMLEAEGWKTWWDTSLTIGDDFRNEIMTQLGQARAVIVIWTDTSIKSDWVRSEAGRAQADRKLIPVKLPHLVYEDLPPPFDVLHTEDIAQENKIKAAVIAQLAKPAVDPSAIALLGKGFKYEVLTWVGIVGGALTLFTNLRGVLQLADWARVLVQHWREWTHAFWLWAFGWLGIHLPPEWTPVLSFLLFVSLLTIGQVIKFNRTSKHEPTENRYEGKIFQLISWRTILCLAVTLPVAYWWYFYLEKNGTWFVKPLHQWLITTFKLDAGRYSIAYYYWVEGAILQLPSLVLLIMFARFNLHASIVIALLVICWYIISYLQLIYFFVFATPFSIWFEPVAFAMIPVLSLILLSVAPAKAVSRRLIFLALGLLLLIGLNELSKLGIDLTAPKVQG